MSSGQDVSLIEDGATTEVHIVDEESRHPRVLVGDGLPAADDAILLHSRVGLTAHSYSKISIFSVHILFGHVRLNQIILR